MLLTLFACVALVASQANPPTWPQSVQVFGPATPPGTITAAVNAAFAENGGHAPPNHGQFSDARFAFLFEPGTYPVDVPVGFYTHVVGLGQSPDDVIFSGAKGVYCEEGDYQPTDGALDTFWRAAENFHSAANANWGVGVGMMWAVSQAAPLRRVHVAQSLLLFEYQGGGIGGYASGGYLGNSKVDGSVVPGSQQQWFTRNSEVAVWKGGVWNMVFLGTKGAPASHCGGNPGFPFTTVASTPLMAEKPFISIDGAGKYSINVPAVKTATTGTDWSTGTAVPFEQVYVAGASTDTAASINAKLSAGLHVVLSPGIYNLTDSLKVVKAGQVLMGLGFPTLVSSNGNAVIEVGDVDGVRLAGPFLLQAGSKATPALLQWGTGNHAGSAANPGFYYDMFARVGGPHGEIPVQAEEMIQVNSGYVVGDNMWLWRADHTSTGLVKNSANPCTTGLHVRGDNVNMYGLAVEHTLGNLVQWEGNNGMTVFYQSEFPYDVTQANYGDKGFASYFVDQNVTAHEGYGLGVYSYFRDNAVVVKSGIAAPAALESKFVNPLSVFLNGLGTIQHVLNDKGAPTGPPKTATAYYCGN